MHKVRCSPASFLPGGVHYLSDKKGYFPDLVSDDENEGFVHLKLGGVKECREWD